MKRNLIARISLDAVLVALYFALASVTIPLGNIHLSFASLPAIVAALLLGVGDACGIALLGETLIQLFSYGITLTTPLWILPPLFRVLLVGVVAALFRRKDQRLEEHLFPYFLTLVIAALLTSAGNTLALYLDALIIGYPFGFVILETVLRFVLGMANSLLVGTACLPLVRALRKLSPSLSAFQSVDKRKQPK